MRRRTTLFWGRGPRHQREEHKAAIDFSLYFLQIEARRDSTEAMRSRPGRDSIEVTKLRDLLLTFFIEVRDSAEVTRSRKAPSLFSREFATSPSG